MTAHGLRLADDLELPLAQVTDTFGILGKKGSGKTSAGVVLFEELYAAGVQVVAVDPKGDWYGVRASADGRGPGMPVPVFGGMHGDVPLEATAGTLMADLIVEKGLSCVLDVSEFSRADVVRFLLAFAQRLYRKAGGHPLHVIAEEAHEYIPQRVGPAEAPLVGAWQRLVKMGRFKGLGVTLVSQRSAAVNKDVLEQVDNLIVLRTTGPRDRLAIKAWVDTHSDVAEILDSLPSLATGEAWLWAPETIGAKRFRFRMRSTYDAGATPRVGEERRAPVTLADVDLEAIKVAMSATIEKAEAEDPAKLRRRVVQLERQASVSAAERDALADRVADLTLQIEVSVDSLVDAERRAALKVHVLDEDLLVRLEKALDPVGALLAEVGERLRWEVTDHGESIEFARDDREGLPAGRPAGDGPRPVADRPAPTRAHPRPAPERPAPRPAQRPDPAPRRRGDGAPGPGAAPALSKAERAILNVLAPFTAGRSKKQVALSTGYAGNGGGFNNALGSLRSKGLITKGEPIMATVLGYEALDGQWEELPTGPALLEQWKAKGSQIGGKAGAAILDALAAVWPASMSKEDLAAATGYVPTGGGFNNVLGRLRTLELIERGEPRLADELAGD